MTDEVSRNERIKEASDYLRGTLAEGLRRRNHRRDRRGRSAAGEIPRHVSAGRPRPARRAHAQEDGEGLRLHDARAHSGRRADARSNGSRSIGRARSTATARMRLTTRQTVQLHGVIKSNLKATLQGDRRSAAQHHRRLRRRQPQRDVQSEPVPVDARTRPRSTLARAISDHLTPRTAGLPRNLARRREDRRRRGGGGRADLRQDLSAAQIQDRGRGAAVERRRRLRARSRLHRDPRRARATSPAGTSPSAAAWA